MNPLLWSHKIRFTYVENIFRTSPALRQSSTWARPCWNRSQGLFPSYRNLDLSVRPSVPHLLGRLWAGDQHCDPISNIARTPNKLNSVKIMRNEIYVKIFLGNVVLMRLRQRSCLSMKQLTLIHRWLLFISVQEIPTQDIYTHYEQADPFPVNSFNGNIT